jgi:hypothetical protein
LSFLHAESLINQTLFCIVERERGRESPRGSDQFIIIISSCNSIATQKQREENESEEKTTHHLQLNQNVILFIGI